LYQFDIEFIRVIMKNQFSAYLDHAITFLLLIVVGFTPLLFLSQTTEFYEIPKLIFLLVSTIVLIGLWIFSSIIKGKVVITRTPLDIPLLILLAVVLISTYFTDAKTAAIYGNFPRVHGSAVSWVVYILLYFVTVSNLRRLTQIKTFVYVLLGSAGLVSLLTLSSFFGAFMPFDFAKAVNFTPTGSSFSTLAFLLLMLPLPILSIINPNKYLPAPAAIALAVLFSVTIVLIGSLPSAIALVLVYVMTFFASKPAQVKKSLSLFLIPVVVTLLTAALAFAPLPGGLGGLSKIEANFPREIQLPFAVSWKVSASAFRDAPFLGTGPSTYLYNFTSYKPLEFNQQPYWNVSFDTASDEFLQILGTLCIFGVIALAFICLVILNNVRKNISVSTKEADTKDATNILLPAVAISGVVSIVLLAIHATTLISLVISLLIFAILMVSQKTIREKEMALSMGIKASTSDNKQFDLFPIIVFVIFLVAAVPVLVQTYNAVAADYYHRQALVQASKNGTLTYQNLQKAESLNPYIDLYRVDMAQTNFALANALAAQKGPSKANPKGSLTDQDKKTIQTLLSQSINESRASVALAPRSSRNWEVLASIYRNIAGVAQNALVYSLDSYGRAIQRDPLNPALRVNVGGIYYSIKNYDLAIRFFSDAANLKPDYANAYFNLAIALRDKGDFTNAKAVADQTVKILSVNPQSADYKVATKLSQELAAKANDKTASGQASSSAQPNSALSNKNENLPNVNVNTQNAPSITPVPSVKPNPNAALPQLSPAPSQAAQSQQGQEQNAPQNNQPAQ
jgi:tetratricopeptide (TPR) repeat protein